ncbi:type I polyketide synthase [Williamsia sterculiae]|uniref:Fatty acid synthase n=1 Tax=Williamsia sterculiae TaxID=1344003 RepID=A0A1N7GL14_9NOCA|nr:type I polyketide synthase [Williamsia sterculiae]SIS13188.1 fatty acid synthase [Williamsia sterculiae]
MTVDQIRSGAEAGQAGRPDATLVRRLVDGEAYAMAFGGQGAAWLPSLAELIVDAELDRHLGAVVDAAERVVGPVVDELTAVRPDGFHPLAWVHALEAGEHTPAESALGAAELSVPGILLTQLAALAALAKQGLDVAEHAPRMVIGHSQGVLAADAIATADRGPLGAGAMLAAAHLIGSAGALVARRRGLAATADVSPLLSVTGVDPARVEALLEEYRSGVAGGERGRAPVSAIRNGRRSVVVSGAPRHLRGFVAMCERVAAREADERKRKTTGGAPFAPVFDEVAASIAFHNPGLADAVGIAADWASRCDLDVEWVRRNAARVLTESLDWVATLDEVAESDVRWILDFGPTDVATRLSAPVVRGRGIGLIPVSLRGGQRNLFAPGGIPNVQRGWQQYAPRLIELPDGSVKVDTAFTRLTGRSPILLAGMTPTTVDPRIVAAATNAGHWAELAGGGQVTEGIFAENVATLTKLLQPGRQAQFNALFLDPYLWKLQLGGKRLVQKARANGAPIDGVVVSAGIPELDEAVALVAELADADIPYVCFKPGTVAQIRSVVRIAAELPHHSIIVHIEGGRAGGHHSWEDLDDLLLATYAELRSRSNVVVCVGGGIGTAERASDYLTGAWSLPHGYPQMPLDGILVGTAAMATKEATTAPEVKKLLVDTPGCDDWIGAGRATAGMASGRSQLGADIHEVDNTASRCGRLLDEVAGDGEAVAERRDEIIAAMAGTAKPYFGDVTSMTYRGWLERYVDLAVGDVPVDDRVSRPVWADISWQQRFVEMLQRTEARLHPRDRGEVPTLFGAPGSGADPRAALDALGSVYPQIDTDILHPADVAFFTQLCRTPGKPVNFVPVIDKDVRRWWRSDSLWQAHDPRYGADAVCIIPGPVAVAGITRVDEPVGALLDRFEARTAADLAAADVEPIRVAGRRRLGIVDHDGVLAQVVESENVAWAGRLVANPISLLGERDRWEFLGDDRAEHEPTGAVLERIADGVLLTVPIATSSITIPMTVGDSVLDGGSPLVSLDAASDAMRVILAVAAGSGLVEVTDRSATVEVHWDPESVADHAAVTAYTLPPHLGATVPQGGSGSAVPDVLVGLCWPTVFSVIGATRDASGAPVVEGLLDLVHLDHAVVVRRTVPTTPRDLTVTAVGADAVDAVVGRVVEVAVTIADSEGVLAELTERFAIRGRTGDAELDDPVRAGGALLDEGSATRKPLRQVTITAPNRMHGFALVSGDRNPIHTDTAAARLAGLGAPIVHGMWLSAAAQQVVGATDARSPLPTPRGLTGWTARFLGMVRTGDEIVIRVDRVGLDRGCEVVEVTAKVGDELVMVATGKLAAAKTVYAFPGQGIQSKGMGLEARSRSRAAREVWDRADEHTRTALGFSILAVVRDNPTKLVANGTTYTHPDGVLFLTQFTQVAMATLGVAQVAELREAGAFVDGAITCGHSVGEYNALAACAGVLPLEAVLEVVFQRGEAMHHLVPRDSRGRSDYRMAAIRPSQFGLADADVVDFVAGIGDQHDEFLQVVNLNLLGSQYAIAGTVRGLELLEAEIERRRLEFGGKRSFILVPGIDVPFHSTVLRDGVPEFRRRLDELLPAEIDPDVLVGRYIPNLVPRLFSLNREFVQEIADLVPSDPITEVLADWEGWAARPSALLRVVLIELLAWQFASPVRWIETQDLLLRPVDQGGLGVERFVEVGVKDAPTLSGLATNTLRLDDYTSAVAEVLNIERDSDVVLARDAGTDFVDEVDESTDEPSTEATAPVAEVATPAAAPAPAAAGPRPDDISFVPSDAVRSVIALWTKLRTDQIGSADTIESLCDGVSSRRNQLLLDIGGELGLGAIDGAAEADMAALASTVDSLARGYKPLGPVLSDAVNDQIRKVFGPTGKRASYVADRVTSVWQLGPGWGLHTTVAVALGSREGVSVRGGDLGDLVDGPIANVAALDALVDGAVTQVGAARGVPVAKPAAEGGGGGTIDASALSELTEQFTGRTGALASAAQTILRKLGLADETSDVDTGDDGETAAVIERVSAELGSDWVRTVAPVFDDRRAVLVDDRWAGAREDLARLWMTDEHQLDETFESVVARFAGAGHTVAAQATWWQGKALAIGESVHARTYAQIAHEAEDPAPGRWADEVAVVTGASAGSIAAGVVGALLAGGATVVATTSRLDDTRLAFFKDLYRTHARFGAALWVTPANMCSYTDVDDLVAWIGSEQTENLGGSTGVVKPALKPTLLFPFAAPRVAGDLTGAGGRAELEMKVLLWSVERLIAGLGEIAADHDLDARVHVVLPGSPNRGMFGGDGAYGESKAALDALVARWNAEDSWNQRVTLAHALIGWVRGTGLMGHNDGMVAAVEAAGVTTWDTDEMAAELLGLCGAAQREAARTEPLLADFTAGLDAGALDLKALAADAMAVDAAETTADVDEVEVPAAFVDALPPPARAPRSTAPAWPELDSSPADLVVIVGAGELGPYGSARTRFEMEVDEELSAAGVLELAWNTGLISWDTAPKPGWYDTESGDPVAESEIAQRYHDAVVERCGIRRYADEGAMVDNTSPLLTSVYLDEDLSFTVATEAEARAFAAADPEKTVITANAETGDWQITRRAGTEIRVPRRFHLSRTVGGQIPTGFDPTRWGISADMASSVDRVALWNLVATVDAFLGAGFDPSELMRWVHPGLVANTQGTGMGGMQSMRSLYVNTLLGEAKPNDILQEALPNVVAAHVVQSYIGSYGAMIHPVAACATAAVSVEEGVDKITLGKALFAVAGGFDDLGIEGIVGFGDMSATADSAKMADRGIAERRFSRANDRRRGGFVESQGGGTILLARGDVAAEMGLPVLGVVAWAQSFGDGVHTSIPAPGIGALGAARGGLDSGLAQSLSALGVSSDDVALVSKHDTSTRANDPNESDLHERLAGALGRNEGAPLFVVSQKSLTGHAKGGAAAFQLIGLCQMLRDGVIPPNRSLDCVDEKMREYPHLVWPTEALRFGERFPLKAGLLTSLGFGHVSGLIAVVHPEAFVATLDPDQAVDYRRRAAERGRSGAQRMLEAMYGGAPAYQRPKDRGFADTAPEADQEAALLLDPSGRRTVAGRYDASGAPA